MQTDLRIFSATRMLREHRRAVGRLTPADA